jgi:hypothetical protein
MDKDALGEGEKSLFSHHTWLNPSHFIPLDLATRKLQGSPPLSRRS